MRKFSILGIITACIFLGFTIKLLIRYMEYENYEKLARQNAIYTEINHADRGLIFDRNRKVVINNILSYSLAVIPAEITKETDTNFICKVLQIKKDDWEAQLRKLINKNGRRRESIFYEYLEPEKRFSLQENLFLIKGFFLKKIPLRNYLYPAGFHSFGYTAEISSKQVSTNPTIYSPNSFIGKNGIERYYDKYLRGQDGRKLWVRNNKNRIIQPYENGTFDQYAEPGKSLLSTIDIDLQVFAEKLMQNKRGAIVAINPKTGGVLCMVSSPNVNPLFIRKDLRKDYYQNLSQDPNLPLFNRSIQGLYSPGSTFKIIEALMAVNEGVITPSFGYNCKGAFYECKKPVLCEHNDPGHASNLEKAITYSCNSYFIKVFEKLWDFFDKQDDDFAINIFRKHLLSLGIGRTLNIDVYGESKGFVADADFYTNLYGNNFWGMCTLMSLGIGQGELLTSPLQLANIMSIIANRGHYIEPHLVDAILDNDYKVIKKIEHKRHEIPSLQKEAYQVIINAMLNVVQNGTASASKIDSINFCGKTGTVENYTTIKGKRIKLKNHAIFTGLAPAENPKICIAVIVENAGFGAQTAAPIASLITEKFINDTISNSRKWWIDHLANQKFLLASPTE